MAISNLVINAQSGLVDVLATATPTIPAGKQLYVQNLSRGTIRFREVNDVTAPFIQFNGEGEINSTGFVADTVTALYIDTDSTFDCEIAFSWA